MDAVLEQIKTLLESPSSQMIQRGTGLPVLELLKEVKKLNSTTLNSKRKPDEGDLMTMYCSVYKEDTTNALEKSLSAPYALEWRCMKCGKTH